MEQLSLVLEASRRPKGAAKALVLATVKSEEWMDIRELSAITGMTRQAIHRIILAPEFEVQHNGLGRGKAIKIRRSVMPPMALHQKLRQLWPVTKQAQL